MIKRLEQTNLEIAKKIRSIFQLSYKVEAELLKAIDFPPLKRPLKDFITSKTVFYGFYIEEYLSGVIEVSCHQEFTYINSLVVDPNFFRQGIARNLMKFIFNKSDSNLFVVETGLKNEPATRLYKSLGFKEVIQWDTDHGVRKIKLEMRKNLDKSLMKFVN